jgi:hypothetical protein
MRTLLSAMIVLATLAFVGCGSSGGNGGGNETAAAPAPAGGSSSATAGRSAAAAQPKNLPKSKDVAILKLDPSEVPPEVRALEQLVDRRSALLADEVRIDVSKNYEWDVSLSGDAVSPQRADQGGTVAEANGNARAYFRNLDIRARNKIVVWRSGLGVTPFIKIYAKGGVSYIDTDDATDKPRVKRGNACQITNSRIAFDDQLIGMPGSSAPAQPAGARDKMR